MLNRESVNEVGECQNVSGKLDQNDNEEETCLHANSGVYLPIIDGK